MAICAPLGSRDGRDPLLVSNHPYYIHVSLLLRLGKAVRPCRTGIFHGSFVVEKNVLCYNQNMGKNRRSKEFKNNSQVIDMEEARARRQQKRRAEKEKKEEKELRAKQQNTRGKRAIRRSKTRRKIITGITIAIIVLLVFLLVFNIISLKKEQYDTKKEQQALKQQKAELHIWKKHDINLILSGFKRLSESCMEYRSRSQLRTGIRFQIRSEKRIKIPTFTWMY